MTRYLLILIIGVGFLGCNAQNPFKPLPKTENKTISKPKPLHPILKIGKEYLPQTHHVDSSFKLGDVRKWNTNKKYGDSIEKEAIRQMKLDSAEEIAYRVKYHFKDYYYMWSYVDGSSNGWGENTITLDHNPSDKEIRNIVWNDFFEDREKVYSLLQIDISEAGNNPNSLQNMSGHDKGLLQYQRVISQH